MILPFISLGLFLLGQVGRVSFNQQEINIYLYEIPYFIWIVFTVANRRENLRATKALRVLLSILLITFLLGITKVSTYANIVSSMYLLRLSLYLVGFGLTIDYFAKKFISSIYIKIYLAFIGVVGVVQYFLYSNLRNLQYLGWDPHQSRVFGQFLDTSVAGAIYGMILIFILFNQRIFPRLTKLLFALPYIFLGLFTYSRGFLVSIFASALGYSLAVKKNFKVTLVTTLILLAFAVLSPKPFGEGVNLLRTSTIESRVEDYNRGLKIWQNNSIVGIGYNRIRYFKLNQEIENRGESHAGASFHSSFLIILVTTGVVGLGAFVYWLWTVAKTGNFALTSAVFLGVYSLFDNILLHPFILFLWPVLIGLTSRKKQ